MSDTCSVHKWRLGPYYIIAAGSAEEPNYYPPQHLMRVEHCTLCGALRLPEPLRPYQGANLAAGTEEVQP